MNKKIFYSELAYVIGVTILALGTAMMTLADFGVSMIVAPAYLLHLKISEFLPFFSFGMAEYLLQAVLLVVTMLVIRRFKVSYLFSFVTAVIYGLMLDGFLLLVGLLPVGFIAVRLALYTVGLLFCCAGVALLFRTYIPPEVYELFVKELSDRYGFDLAKCKTVYDCASCLVGILLSFAFFGLWHFEGIKLGTIVCTILNGTLIGLFGKLFERYFTFSDKFEFRNKLK